MHVDGSQIKSYVPGSLVEETPGEGVEALPAKESPANDAAKGFLESTDSEKLVSTAVAVAKQLKGPDGKLNNLDLPCDLTPLHIACLASDMELLMLALTDNFCQDHIDQHTSSTAATATSDDAAAATATAASASPRDNNETDKPPIAMNHDTALHFALLTGWNEGALRLIDELDVQEKLNNTTNNSGESLLSLAASHSSLDVVRKLCKHFSTSENYHSYLFHKAEHQRTLLHCAVEQDDPEVFRHLHEQQAISSLKITKGSAHDPGNRLQIPSTTRGDKDKNGKTPDELIELKVALDMGLNMLRQMRDNPALIKQKRSEGFQNPWQPYYLQNVAHLMEARSWIPPWQQCTLV